MSVHYNLIEKVWGRSRPLPPPTPWLFTKIKLNTAGQIHCELNDTLVLSSGSVSKLYLNCAGHSFVVIILKRTSY